MRYQRDGAGWLPRLLAGALLAVALIGQAAVAVGTTPSDVGAPVWGYRVVATYPHDAAAFTQGLAYDGGVLYEGTGLWGASTLREVDLATGAVLRSRALPRRHFGEGIAALDERLYQLTWRTGTCLVYDRATFDLLETFTYPSEGWGLAAVGERLVMSDGTDTLVFRDPATFVETGRVVVRDRGVPIEGLNELEAVDGEIWANVWPTDRVARIDPATGEVIGWVDLTGLLAPEDRLPADGAVLNGIAHDPGTGRLFVTGKLWPTLFEIEPVPPTATPT